ncbi:MAG: class I SAM-dependent rRNA methyltransferase [Steroidobacteraceae bacterium]|nr:class I SAM-dependent rRNA methyltransferase [Steroidobacteraceae bacterium]
MPDENAPDTDSLAAASGLPRLVLKPREERRLQAGHLWIFSNEVDVQATPLTACTPGEVASVFSSKDRFLGYASVNPHTLIAARLLSRVPSERPGRGLFVRRLEAAKALRERFYHRPFYRLAFGESDLLPGLVVDRYGDTCVVQLGTAGMEAMKDGILTALGKVVGPRAVLWKNDSPLRELEGLPLYVEAALGDIPDSVEVEEGGVRFAVPLAAGQKTGWFFDQALNRSAIARHCAGARVLDVFSYAGGFGLQAARAGASEVTCVDASAGALAAVEASAAANGLAVSTVRGDAFEVLEAFARERRRFDVVIVDPPAFIKRRKDHGKGLAAYKRLNQLALQLVDRDGILMSCSCSSHLAEGELIEAVQRAVRHVDRFVQLVWAGGQAPDHPVHPAIPETRYLKALMFRVLHA